ncbi:hypothetical protein K1719_011233 [Acacia pycnantha]|nr:hypothetical protein K1719_011233 [Acacia pycnantha]
MNSNVGEGKVVCVTGASGYIASWRVKFLLRGYTVKSTVRDPTLSTLPTEIIDPAVKGTLNVLKSCTKSPNVKRVVLTSSTAAVVFNGNPLTADTAVDETWFSSPDICRDIKSKIEESSLTVILALCHICSIATFLCLLGYKCWYNLGKTLTEEAAWKFAKENGIDLRWYNLGKTLAEEAAWKFAKENGIDLVALNPAFMIGPLLQPLLNESSAIIFNLVKDVANADIANAHIQAFEIPSASGRYNLVERVAHYSEHVKILHELFPTLQLAEKFSFPFEAF